MQIAVRPETALKCLEPAQLHPGLLWPSAVPSSGESVFVWQSRSEDVHISSSSPCCIAFQFCLWSQIWNWWDRMSRHLAFLLFAAASISLASGLSWPQWPPAQVLFKNDIAGKTWQFFWPSLWFPPIIDNEHTCSGSNVTWSRVGSRGRLERSTDQKCCKVDTTNFSMNIYNNKYTY